MFVLKIFIIRFLRMITNLSYMSKISVIISGYHYSPMHGCIIKDKSIIIAGYSGAVHLPARGVHEVPGLVELLQQLSVCRHVVLIPELRYECHDLLVSPGSEIFHHKLDAPGGEDIIQAMTHCYIGTIYHYWSQLSFHSVLVLPYEHGGPLSILPPFTT